MEGKRFLLLILLLIYGLIYFIFLQELNLSPIVTFFPYFIIGIILILEEIKSKRN